MSSSSPSSDDTNREAGRQEFDPDGPTLKLSYHGALERQAAPARIAEPSEEQMDEWQVLEHDHCAAEWYFQSIPRRRLVYDDLLEAFPFFYGKGEGKTMRPMSGERGSHVAWRLPATNRSGQPQWRARGQRPDALGGSDWAKWSRTSSFGT